jgi:hypothetical protein
MIQKYSSISPVRKPPVRCNWWQHFTEARTFWNIFFTWNNRWSKNARAQPVSRRRILLSSKWRKQKMTVTQFMMPFKCSAWLGQKCEVSQYFHTLSYKNGQNQGQATAQTILSPIAELTISNLGLSQLSLRFV